MKVKITFVSILGVIVALSSAASAQDKVTMNGSIDLVNNYVWHGTDQDPGSSVRPSSGLSYEGLSLPAWCSQSLTNNADRGVQELDINLSYSIGGLSTTLADYWWDGLHNPYGYYKQGLTDNPIDGGHHFEATVAYNSSTRPFLTLGWSTWFAGADMRTDSDKRYCSTCINASHDIVYPVKVISAPSIGFTPWRDYYNDKVAIIDVSLRVSKNSGISGKFLIPLFVQAIVPPINDHVYFVTDAGIRFWYARNCDDRAIIIIGYGVVS